MSIWQKAYETYENHAHLAGAVEEGKQSLTPVGHIVQKAQIEITIRADGTFDSASPIDQKDCKTIIPATEASAARTQAPVPHPLCEQLGYLIPGSERCKNYLEQLTAWANSPHTTPKVNAILQYIRGGTILQDLAGEKLVSLNEDGTLASGKTAGADYEKCMIRWRVYDGTEETAVWRDQQLFAAFQQFQRTAQEGRDLCMISGEPDSIAASHPKGTLANAYGAKLISANDGSGFTYRGRFTEPIQAAAIGYQASQKVHSALQWLCANQGVIRGGRTFLVWNPKGKKVYSPWDDWFDDVEEAMPAITPSNYRERLEKTLDGWKKDLPDGEDVVIAAFEAATTGRLSITYYSEMKASDYHKQVFRWYDTCCLQSSNGKVLYPKLSTIVKAAFGTEQEERIKGEKKLILKVNDKLYKEYLQRLLYCLTEGAEIPQILVQALCDHASRPLCYQDRDGKNKESKNRAKVLFTACAVLRKYLNDQESEEKWTMILDENQRDRSYLFGRILAVMEYYERITYAKDEAREPNAIRTQTVFAQRPLDTATMLKERLEPYLEKLHPAKRAEYNKLIGHIFHLIEDVEGENIKNLGRPLESTYLLGYYLQRNELYKSKKDNAASKEE